jgi:hypothetical protein
MYICLNAVEIVFLLVLMLCLLLIPTLIVRHYYEEKRKTDLRQFAALQPFTEYERQMLSKNFIFTTLWTINDIRGIAYDMGVTLDHTDHLQVVNIVKANFEKRRGVNVIEIHRAIAQLIKSKPCKH